MGFEFEVCGIKKAGIITYGICSLFLVVSGIVFIVSYVNLSKEVYSGIEEFSNLKTYSICIIVAVVLNLGFAGYMYFSTGPYSTFFFYAFSSIFLLLLCIGLYYSYGTRGGMRSSVATSLESGELSFEKISQEFDCQFYGDLNVSLNTTDNETITADATDCQPIVEKDIDNAANAIGAAFIVALVFQLLVTVYSYWIGCCIYTSKEEEEEKKQTINQQIDTQEDDTFSSSD